MGMKGPEEEHRKNRAEPPIITYLLIAGSGQGGVVLAAVGSPSSVCLP